MALDNMLTFVLACVGLAFVIALIVALLNDYGLTDAAHDYLDYSPFQRNGVQNAAAMWVVLTCLAAVVPCTARARRGWRAIMFERSERRRPSVVVVYCLTTKQREGDFEMVVQRIGHGSDLSAFVGEAHVSYVRGTFDSVEVRSYDAIEADVRQLQQVEDRSAGQRVAR